MTDSVVVDPILVPDWLRDRVRRTWANTPLLARGFIALAIVDIAVRWFGILEPPQSQFLDLRAFYVFFIPSELWILLPAMLLVRRPDAAQATPLILYGAVVVAVVRVVGEPINALLGAAEPSAILPVVTGLALLTACGWLLLARGLRQLNPAQPAATAAGLSNLVLGISLLGTGVGVVSGLLRLGGDSGSGTGGLDLLLTGASAVDQVAWAYLLWIVIRGVGDSRRPRRALAVAATGATLTGILTAIASTIGQILVATQPGGDFSTVLAFQDIVLALGFIAFGVGEALLVASFALGLAEPPIPYAPPVGAAPRPAPEPSARPTLPSTGDTSPR